MMIKEIQSMPNGTKVGGFTATIKKPKTKLECNGEWTQEVVLADSTGEIQAEIALYLLPFTNIYHVLNRGETIEILEAQLQSGVDGLRLYVFRYIQPTISEPVTDIHYSPAEIAEYSDKPDWDAIFQRDARLAILCAKITAHDDIVKSEILELVEFCWKGK